MTTTGFDAAGQLKAITYPDGVTPNVVFDDSPHNYTDPTGLLTAGLCMSLSGGLGIGGFVQVCVLYDGRDYALTESIGAGWHSPSLSGGGQFLMSTADDVANFAGEASYVGGSYGEGLAGIVDVAHMLQCDGRNEYAVEVGIGAGFWAPSLARSISDAAHPGFKRTAVQYTEHQISASLTLSVRYLGWANL